MYLSEINSYNDSNIFQSVTTVKKYVYFKTWQKFLTVSHCTKNEVSHHGLFQ